MNRTWKLVLTGLIFGVVNPAWAADVKPVKATRAEAPAEVTQSVSSVSKLAGGAGGGAAAASYARQADTGQPPCPEEPALASASVSGSANTAPDGIAMNATVAKQTQGATFGEKVNAGLHSAGGALAQGASAVGGISGGAVAGRCAKPAKAESSGTSATTEK